LQACRPCS